MSKKIFVGGISFQADDDDLRELCEQFGEVVEVKIIMDRETGRSRGFGFVTFTDDDAAETAINELDGSDFLGRTIRVNEAQERQGGGGGRRGGGRY